MTAQPDADVIFTARDVSGEPGAGIAVDKPASDGTTTIATSDGEHLVVVRLNPADTQRLGRVLAVVGAETGAEWAAKVTFVDGTTKTTPAAAVESHARLEVSSIRAHIAVLSEEREPHPEDAKRAELVRRDVHTTADGWTHTGPWAVVDSVSKEA